MDKTARTPTTPIQLLTAAQKADFEQACEVLGINPEKRLSEWRIDSMSLTKQDVDLFVQEELKKLVKEAQGKEPLGDGAGGLDPKGPSVRTRQKRKSAPQEVMTRFIAAIQEAERHVKEKAIAKAAASLGKAEAAQHDLMNTLEENVVDKLMGPEQADAMSVEASKILGTTREAFVLMRKMEAARQKEANARRYQQEEDQEEFFEAEGETDPEKRRREQSRKDDRRGSIEAARLQLQTLRENCELAIREAARSSEAVNKERLSVVHIKADALRKTALSAAAWSSGNRREASCLSREAEQLVEEVAAALRPRSWRDEGRKKASFYKEEEDSSTDEEAEEAEVKEELDVQTACLLQISKTMANLGKEVRKGGDTSKWPKFDETYASYPLFKRNWRSHAKAYHSGVDEIVLVKAFRDNSVSEKLAKRLRFHRKMGSLWEELDSTFLRPDKFVEDLLRPVLEQRHLKDYQVSDLEDYYNLVLYSLEEAQEMQMEEEFLSLQNIAAISDKLPDNERRRWYSKKSEANLHTRRAVAHAFEEFVRRQHAWARSCAAEESKRKRPEEDKKRHEDRDRKRETEKKKHEDKKKGKSYPKAAVHAGTAAAPGGAPAPGGAGGQQPVRRPPKPCVFPGCQEVHPLFRCQKFIDLQPVEKVDLLNNLNRCLLCYNHSVGLECFRHSRSGFPLCGVNGCKEMHHSTLHEAVKKAVPPQQVLIITADCPSFQAVAHMRMCEKVQIEGPGGETPEGRKGLCVYDWGSTVSLVTHSYARDNGWMPERCNGREVIAGLAGKEVKVQTLYTAVLKNKDTGKSMAKVAIGVDYICEPIKHVATPAVVVDMFRGLNVPREQKGGPVDLLMGTDWMEHMPMAVDRVYSMQLVQSLITEDRMLCGEVPSVREWEEYRCAYERHRQERNLVGPVPRNVHSRHLRPGEGPFPVPGGFVRERRLQNPPEEVTIGTDDEEEEKLSEHIRRIPEGSCRPAKKGKRDGPPSPSKDRRRGRGRGHGMLANGLLASVVLGLMMPAVQAFAAYDCNNITVPVESYSLLEPEACLSGEKNKQIERDVFGEVVQMKQDRYVSVFRCQVTETVFSQYCGWNHAAGVLRPLKWHQVRSVEPQDCRVARVSGKLKINGRDFDTTPGTTVSHSIFLQGGLTTVDSKCSVGNFAVADKIVAAGQTAQAIYHITTRTEQARVNDIEMTIKMASGIRARISDKSVVDSLEGCYIWETNKTTCPDSLVTLYKGPIKVFSNSTASLSGGMAIVDDPIKEQVAGLELGEQFLMCGSAAYKTHVKNLILFVHAHPSMSIATGSFHSAPDDADTTRLETELSFLQVRNSMQLAQKLRQVGAEICANRREIAQTRLESVAGSANPYSLISTFGHGHLVTRAGAAAYVTKCALVDVMPRHTDNCTGEIPAIWGEKEIFVDPISYVIKPLGTPMRCNDIAPVRYLIAGRWYCASPLLRECTPPKSLPVEPVNIDETSITGQGLGRSIYNSKQLADFAAFQDSQGTRQAYLAETAKLAYNHMSGHGSFGLGLNDFATGQIVDLIGLAFVPLYFIFGPPAITIVLNMTSPFSLTEFTEVS